MRPLPGIVAMRDRLSHMHLPLFLVMSICGYNLAFGLPISGSSDEPSKPTYHSVASEVRLVFFATDEHNHSVQELEQDDSAVVDDDMVIRDFRSFTRSAAIKLDVIVLMDSSESVLPNLRQEIADIRQLISQSPWSSEDSTPH
jgi:hypothetical protein